MADIRTGSILQWNIHDIREKEDEISELISRYRANVVAIQEIKLWSNTRFRLPGFTEIRKDGQYNRGAHGGVAMCIHNSIPFNNIDLNTPLQAVADNVQLQRRMCICNIYVARSQELREQDLANI